MNKWLDKLRWVTGSLLLVGALSIGAVTLVTASNNIGTSEYKSSEHEGYKEYEEHEKHEEHEEYSEKDDKHEKYKQYDKKYSEKYEYENKEKYLKYNTNEQAAANTPQSPMQKQFNEECSACHVAYPAQFLPARSWQKIMSNLDDHFGENAELSADVQQAITSYLVNNSADNSSSKRARKFIKQVNQNETPIRITELAYFTNKHDEIPERLVTGNKEVGSFSQCQACHGKSAEIGVFDEDSVYIPGYGRWDD